MRFVCLYGIGIVYLLASMSDIERKEAFYSCLEDNKQSCQILIEDGLPSVEDCDVETTCHIIAHIYDNVSRLRDSIPYYQKSCKHRIESCFNLAINYELLGQYLDADIQYQHACDEGFNAACYNLAILYLNNSMIRTKKNRADKKANALLLEACGNEHALSCHSLAVHYRNGIGVKANRLQAREFFKRACNMGYSESCRELQIIDAAEFSITKPKIQK